MNLLVGTTCAEKISMKLSNKIRAVTHPWQGIRALKLGWSISYTTGSLELLCFYNFAATSHWMQDALGRRCNLKSGISLPPGTFPSAEVVSPLVKKDDLVVQHSTAFNQNSLPCLPIAAQQAMH